MHRYSLNDLKCGCFITVLLSLPGCGGMQYGNDIRVPPNQRQVIKSDGLADKTLDIPKDRSFNIHVKESGQNPGANGQARGQSDATDNGNASALAESSNGGSASAQFNLGHRIENLSDASQSVTVQFDYELTQSIKASYIPKPDTLANANLHLLIIDSKKRSLATMPLVQITSDQATADASTRDSRSLTVRFEPRQTYDVMLFGRVDAASTPGQEAFARLDVKNLQMRFTFEPVATQPAQK